MGKYRDLLEKYERLDEAYTKLKEESLECQYQYQKLKKEYIEQADQQEEIKELHESARRLKHDMKNHMLVLAAYLNDGQVEEAKEYVSGIFNKLNQMYTYIETANPILNYCLNTKLLKANERNIQFKVEVENLGFRRIESVDLSAILTNLLDNAIEGSAGVIDPYLEIKICKKRSYETILIKNKINQSVLSQNPTLKTTKENQSDHGCGLNQVGQLVEKYDGMLDLYEKDHMFCVCVAVYP